MCNQSLKLSTKIQNILTIKFTNMHARLAFYWKLLLQHARKNLFLIMRLFLSKGP